MPFFLKGKTQKICFPTMSPGHEGPGHRAALALPAFGPLATKPPFLKPYPYLIMKIIFTNRYSRLGFNLRSTPIILTSLKIKDQYLGEGLLGGEIEF